MSEFHSESNQTDDLMPEGEGVIDYAYVPHIPCVLLIDRSSSMNRKSKIDLVERGVRQIRKDLSNHDVASERADISIISFGNNGVTGEHWFTSPKKIPDLNLTAKGNTPMGEAIITAIDYVEERKNHYNETGVEYNRPLIFMLTDGKPTDMAPGTEKWEKVQKKLERGEREKKFAFFPAGIIPESQFDDLDSARDVKGIDVSTLNKLTQPNTVAFALKPGAIVEYFQILSDSIARSSESADKSDRSVEINMGQRDDVVTIRTDT